MYLYSFPLFILVHLRAAAPWHAKDSDILLNLLYLSPYEICTCRYVDYVDHSFT